MHPNRKENITVISDDPFAKRSRVTRSPPAKRVVDQNQLRTRSTSVSTPPATYSGTTTTTQVSEETDELAHLGNLIREHMEFVCSKPNVLHAIKDQTRVIRAAYQRVLEVSKKVNKSVEATTQTAPTETTSSGSSDKGDSATVKDLGQDKTKPSKSRKRQGEPMDDVQLSHRAPDRKKRRKREKPLQEGRQKQSDRPPNANSKENPPDGRTVCSTEGINTPKEGSAWTKVERKKKLKRKKEKPTTSKKLYGRTRPDALIIKTTSELSYAEILRKVKGDSSLAGLGDQVTRIRRTQKGELLLELKTGEVKTEDLQQKVKTSVGELAEVRASTNQVAIECRDLDEITTKAEVCEALRNQLGLLALQEQNVVGLRKAYGGTQTATISMSAEMAKKALAAGKARIGWVVCRIREQPTRRCYKCWELGHIAKKCASTQDRRDQCLRCGKKGHIAKNCDGSPKCLLCKEANGRDSAHGTSSNKCPLFQKALKQRRK